MTELIDNLKGLRDHHQESGELLAASVVYEAIKRIEAIPFEVADAMDLHVASMVEKHRLHGKFPDQRSAYQYGLMEMIDSANDLRGHPNANIILKENDR